MSDTLEQMIRIAAEAAVVVNEVYDQPFEVDYKGPADPVTEADRRANELICNRLAEAFPDAAIVAEESAEERWSHFRSSQRVFFVDPVDGTREFVARNGEFVVMIGLVEGDRATHGVIHAPAQHVAWAGEVGRGAFELRDDGTRSPLEVGTTTEVGRASVVSSRSHRSPLLEQCLSHLGPAEIVALGSAGLKGVAVARRVADIYFAPRRAGSLWDACAPDAIVQAAGGRFSNATGEPIDYRAEDVRLMTGILAAQPELHEQVARAMTAFLATQ